jgi:hypothetical protein
MAEGGSLPSGSTSRKNREVYTRFCERLRVKFPGPTRRIRVQSINSPSTPSSFPDLLMEDNG